VVDCGRLEICCTETYRGFESLPLRQIPRARPASALALVFWAVLAVAFPGEARAHPACVKLETPQAGRTVAFNACGECQVVVLAMSNGCGARKVSHRLEPGKSHLLRDQEWPQCTTPGTSSTAALDDVKPCHSPTTPKSEPSDRQ
jgi:hypothetical protein